MMVQRVAIISVHGCPLARLGEKDTGGMNVYVLELARELARQGITVDVYTRVHDPQEPRVVFLQERAQVIHLPAGPYDEGKTGIYGYLSEFLDRILEFQSSHGLSYEIVHTHYWLSGLVGLDLAARWDVPHITTFHTLAEVKRRARPGEYEPDLRAAMEFRICHEADLIIAFSQHEKESLERFYHTEPSKIRVVPCGVDSGRFRPMDRFAAKKALGLEGKKVALFVGRIEPLKGLDLLLQAVAQVEDKEDLAVLIVGGNPRKDQELERLHATASSLGLAQTTRFTGTVAHQELPTYYNAAEVLVLPSYYESFGLVALEAMACGVPVIAARVGGLQYVVREGETGYLLAWHCPDIYAERLEVLLNNEDLRQSMGKAARSLAADQTWGAMAQELANAYDSLLFPAQPALCKV
ncbi:MAG: glycosyltransferase [Chloroflexi bacterium]|nr:glycosyltransferase [Chloroflexota bacterium]